MRTDRVQTVVMVAALAVAGSVVAEAQVVVRQPRGALGFYGTVARPAGDFQDFVSWGGGFGMYGFVNFGRGRHVGIRLDGKVVWYGHESFDAPLSQTIRRVWVDVDTDNLIVALGVGPQITFGSGPLRPYVYGTAGFSYFYTVSSAGDFASSIHQRDLTLALAGGGGFLIRLLRMDRGRHSVLLDLSVQYTYKGEAVYLRRGGVRENPDGSVSLFPIRSETNLVTFRAGVAVVL